MRIVIVEDNKSLGTYLVEAMKEEGFAVDWFQDGSTALRHLTSTPPDILILDINLPSASGFDICAEVRAQKKDFPILLLTARGETQDRVQGLDAGADDYLVKPFEIQELLARVRALFRRPKQRTPVEITVQDLTLHPNKRMLYQKGKEIPLTSKEYAILEYLFHNVDHVVSRSELIEHCWEFSYNPFSNITDVYIRKLRKKLHDREESYIETIRGAGYKLKG